MPKAKPGNRKPKKSTKKRRAEYNELLKEDDAFLEKIKQGAELREKHKDSKKD